METRLTAGMILARAGALFLRTLPAALPAFLALGAIGIAFDFYPELGMTINLANLAVTLFAQYLVMRAAMSNAGLELSDRPGAVNSFFGAAFITSLVSGLALLVLIVPGVYLYARWALATPIVLGEGERMSEAMRISDERTKGNMVPIAIALVIANLPWVAVLPALFYLYPAEGEVPLIWSILTSVGVYSAYLASWFCVVVIHALLRPNHDLEDVFA